ncbi:carotenoid 1,2-hydratase [Desulfosarcina widdelii]|uniref:Carotenoid 1,2-hydratase n=1 Tax=Desulfosarcina widdelii TaxID=947919 RepID=A0A5K7Z5R4_9BACT|nr:lipocalin-like domain-containing protein [Desulfosarcina widdelii]BBO76070.1 carotenoid 1,2-hydratase [Desulfosarcina widdelii]
MGISHHRSLLFWFLLLVVLAAGPAGTAEQGFVPVTGPCNFSFPDDHGPHPAYRTEWWYYTGNLTDEENHRFGFQLTFFRSGLRSPDQRRDWPQPASAWRSDQIYLAHAAVSDIHAGRHLQAERMARPVLSLAGAEQTDAAVTITVYDWQAVIRLDSHRLAARADDFGLALDLTAAKPPVAHGEEGYSRKGQSPERASCYYSFTRLQAQGELTVEGTRRRVKGSAWMDHEFSTAPLQPGIVGWDWFSLQLSDRTEVMLFLLRQPDGTVNPASSGTFVLPSGDARHLQAGDLQATPLAYWTSPHSGARYPIQWRLQIPSLELDLALTAGLEDQEMRTPHSTGVVYWEGSVRARGTRGQKAIEGLGYVELTGYAEPFDAPM